MYRYSILISIYQDFNTFKIFWDSLLPSLDLSTQVILVDDASPRDTSEFLKEIVQQSSNPADIELLKHSTTMGFAYSINEALSVATGEFIITMDSDLIIHSDWKMCVEHTMIDQSIGGMGGVLVYPQTGGIQCAGVAYTKSLGRHVYLNARTEHLPFTIPYEVQNTVFAFFATRKMIVQKVGYLDTDFFNGYEDVDYQFRIRKVGYKIVVDPKCHMYHWERSNGRFRDYGRRSNLALLWKKHADFIHEDLWDFLFSALDKQKLLAEYRGIDLCCTRIDANTFWGKFRSQYTNIHIDIRECWHKVEEKRSIWLSCIVPLELQEDSIPHLILCDHFIQLQDNYRWCEQRQNNFDKDIIVDLYGNVTTWPMLFESFWPGNKIR